MGKEYLTNPLSESISRLFENLKKNAELADVLDGQKTQEDDGKLLFEGFSIDIYHKLSLEEKHQRLDENTAALLAKIEKIYPTKRIEEKSVFYHYLQELKGKVMRKEIDDQELFQLFDERKKIIASMNMRKGDNFPDFAGFSND